MDSAPPLNLSKSAKSGNCNSAKKLMPTVINRRSNVVKAGKTKIDDVILETPQVVAELGTNNSSINHSAAFDDSNKSPQSCFTQITVAKEKEEPSNDSITHIVSILDAAQTLPEPGNCPVNEEASVCPVTSLSTEAILLAEGTQSITNEGGDYKCDKCDQAFVRAPQLRTHVKNEHSSNKGEGSHQCDQCDAKFNRASQLLQHRQTHKPSDGSLCSHCNEPMYTYQDYRAHHKMHNKTYQCHECGVTFMQKVYLTVHARVHSGEKPFKCNTCFAAFKQLSHLTTHKRTHTHEQPFVCASCPARFSQSSSLKRHYRTHTGEKPYICSVCSSAFSDKRNMTRHMMCHKGIKPYECTHCQAKFSQKIDLQRHNLSHLGVKPFKCSICGVAFSRKNNLMWHERTHDQKTSQQTCAACGIGFSNVRDLKRHYREHNVTKNLSCKLCGIAVSCRFSLLRHMKTHTNNRPFVCSACPAAFMQLSTLKKHEMRHKGEPDEKPPTFSTVYDHKPLSSQTKNVLSSRVQLPPKNEVVLSSGQASSARSIVVEASEPGPQYEAVMALSDTSAADAQTLVLSQPGEPPKTYRLAGNCQNHQNHFITFLDGNQWQAWCVCNPQNLPAEHMESKHSITDEGANSVVPGTIFHGDTPSSQQNGISTVPGQGVMNVSNSSFNDASPSFDAAQEPHFSYTTDRFSSHLMESEANSVYTFTPDGDSYLVQPVCEDPGCDVGNSTLPNFHPNEIDGQTYDESIHNLTQEDVKNANLLQGDLQSKELQSSNEYSLTVNNPMTGSIKITSKTYDASRAGNVTSSEKIKSTKGNQRKKYQCTICFKWFLRKVHLSIHMRRHTKEKPYKCTICFALFTHNNTLVAHMRSHTGERPFRCEICGVGFAQKSNLTAHMRIHTGEKPYRCDVCNMGFRQASHLPTHRRTHSNERPYVCNVCSKRFTQNSALKRHMKTHQRSKRNDFKCSKCPESFHNQVELQNHALMHEDTSGDVLGYSCAVEDCRESFTDKKLFDTLVSSSHLKNGVKQMDADSLNVEEEQKHGSTGVKYLVSPKSGSERHKAGSADDLRGKRKRKPRGASGKPTSKASSGAKTIVAASRSSQRIRSASARPKREKNPEFITGDFLNLSSPDKAEPSAPYSADACKSEMVTEGEFEHGRGTSDMGDWCFCEVPHAADQPHSISYRPLPAAQVAQSQQQPTFSSTTLTNNISVAKNVFSLNQEGSESEFYAFVDEKGNVMKASVTEILNSSTGANVSNIVADNPPPSIDGQQNLLSNVQVNKSKDINNSFQPVQSIVLEQPSEQNALIVEDVTHIEENFESHGSGTGKPNVPDSHMDFETTISLPENVVSSTITDSHRLLEMSPLVPSGGVVQLVDDSSVQIVGTVGTDGKMQLFNESNIQVVDTRVVNAASSSVPASLPSNNDVISTSNDLNSFSRVHMYDGNQVQIVNSDGNASSADALNNLAVGGGENGGLQMLTLVSERQDIARQTPSDESSMYLNTSTMIVTTQNGSTYSDIEQGMTSSVGAMTARHPPADKGLSTKGYACPLCSVVQLQWRAFIAHVKDAHPDQHMCSVCYRVFDEAADLKCHFNEKHSLSAGGPGASGLTSLRRGSGNESARLCCFECNIQFREDEQLSRHLSDVHKANQHTTGSSVRRRKVPCRGKGTKRNDVSMVNDDGLSNTVMFIPPGMDDINSQIVNISADCHMQTPSSCGIFSSAAVQESVHSNAISGGICIINSTTSADLNISPPISNTFVAAESSVVGGTSTDKNIQFDTNSVFEGLPGTSTTTENPSTSVPLGGTSRKGVGVKTQPLISPSKRRRKADKHACAFCGEKFASQCDLERHTLQHTGEKPYVCSICSASFTRKSSLNNHERIHSGMKPYVCSVCNESFSYRYQFNKHKSSVH
ncbi:Zinc finger C2H2-type [Trinorchestia longiramus]|nr:Zinc finger C2H2-type [Trinorchestia longiramus]